jgi:methyltransferase (TIGR00027 family)
MRDDQASRTALRVAVRRAAHQLLDRPKVFDDPLAVAIIGAEEADRLASAPEEARHPASRFLRAFVAARSRFAEDQLVCAVARGSRQCVILGAGLDTFAYRSPRSDLTIFEVDHPATQAWKRQRLQAAAIAIPASVVFAPVDFAKQNLVDELRCAGFKTDAAAFFSWLGVTQYLTRETVFGTLKLIGSLCPANAITFDFAVPRSSLDARNQIAFDTLARRVRAAGEPFVGFFTPGELAEHLRSAGFRNVQDLGPDQINARYFKDRADGLSVGGQLARLMCGWS